MKKYMIKLGNAKLVNSMVSIRREALYESALR